MSVAHNWATTVHMYQKVANDKSKILAEGDAMKITVAGHEGECVMRKASLVEKSGFFRAMLSSNFQGCRLLLLSRWHCII